MKTLFPIVILALLISCKSSEAPSIINLVEKGNRQLDNYHIDSAIATFQKAVSLNPNAPEGHYGLGVAKAISCYQHKGGCEEAIKHLKQVENINPNFKKTYFNIGTVYIALEEYPKAIRYLDKAIKNDPENGDYYMNRGIIYLHLEKRLKACEDFQLALKYNCKHESLNLTIESNCN